MSWKNHPLFRVSISKEITQLDLLCMYLATNFSLKVPSCEKTILGFSLLRSFSNIVAHLVKNILGIIQPDTCRFKGGGRESIGVKS